jgi:hypothetical protein
LEFFELLNPFESFLLTYDRGYEIRTGTQYLRKFDKCGPKFLKSKPPTLWDGRWGNEFISFKMLKSK